MVKGILDSSKKLIFVIHKLLQRAMIKHNTFNQYHNVRIQYEICITLTIHFSIYYNILYQHADLLHNIMEIIKLYSPKRKFNYEIFIFLL